jgi:hypothetical protein
MTTSEQHDSAWGGLAKRNPPHGSLFPIRRNALRLLRPARRLDGFMNNADQEPAILCGCSPCSLRRDAFHANYNHDVGLAEPRCQAFA